MPSTPAAAKVSRARATFAGSTSKVRSVRLSLAQARLSQSAEYPALVPTSIAWPGGAAAHSIARNRPVSGGTWRRRLEWGVPSPRSRSSAASSLRIWAAIFSRDVREHRPMLSGDRRSALAPRYPGGVPDLVLLRHGESAWNAENRFTGWTDVDLSERGEAEAESAGALLAAEPGLDLRVLHTSVLTRSIRTAEISLHAAGRSWLPVRRTWRLNERHYGDLTGKDKRETAAPVRPRPGDRVAPQLRDGAAVDAAGRPAIGVARPALPRRAARVPAGDRVPEGRRRARRAVPARHAGRGPARRERARRRGHRGRPRQLAARAAHDPPAHRRGRHRRPRDPHRDPLPRAPRRRPRRHRGALPRRRGDRDRRGGRGRRARPARAPRGPARWCAREPPSRCR